jgi:hypothetical protein
MEKDQQLASLLSFAKTAGVFRAVSLENGSSGLNASWACVNENEEIKTRLNKKTKKKTFENIF